MPHITDERGYNQIFARSPAQELRLHRRASAIKQALDGIASSKDARLLELGCGTGELSRILAGMTGGHVTGVDLSPHFIATARQNHSAPNLDYRVADLTRDDTSMAECRYHAIFGNGILHHLYHHLDTVLPALRRRLHPGGRFLFWEPNLWNPYVWAIFSHATLRRHALLEPDEMAFSSPWIMQKLSAAGFQDIRVSTRDFLLPITPAKLIKPLVWCGDLAERIPLVRRMTQSLFISATNPVHG